MAKGFNERGFIHAVTDALLEAGARNNLCAEHAFKEAFVFIGSVIVANDGPKELKSLVGAALAIGSQEKEGASAEGRSE